MIPGKKYAPEELLAIVWRRKWLVGVCVAVGAAAAFGYGRTLPKRFTSETVVMLLPQRVAENVAPASRLISRVEERLKSMPQRVTSRARLERAINDLNLYAGSGDCRSIDEKVECMRKDTDARIVGPDSFKVAYTAADPQLAARVADRLASEARAELVDESKSDSTKNLTFIEESLGGARKQLEEQEKKLEIYRKTYSGELPDQLQSNEQTLQNTQLQLQNLLDSLSRDRDRRLSLNQDLGNVLSADAPPETIAVGGQPRGEAAPPLPPVVEQLIKQNEELKSLLARGYTEQHPDVMAARKNVRQLEQQVAQLPKAHPGADPVSPVVAANPRALARAERIRDLRKELDITDRQIAAKQVEERRLLAVVDQMRRRIDATPTRESELTALTRDYQTINNLYTSLLAQKEAAMITVRAGEQNELFKVLDPPRVPRRPSSPDMPRILATGGAIGLGLALALIALVEYRNSTLRDEDEVAACTGLPVIAVIPLMVPPAAVKPAPRIRRLFAGPAGAVR